MTFEIKESDITREKLSCIKGFTEETKQNINNSDILILPKLDFRNCKTRVFHAPTSDFLKIAKEELKQFKINLCENKGEEKSLTLRCGEVWIPTLLISIEPLKDIILPTILNLIVNYIFYKFGKKAEQDGLDIHLEILVENKQSKITKSLKYDGKLSGLKSLNVDAKELFKENGTN